MKVDYYLSWDVTQFKNEYGDEIEMEIIQYPNEYLITVNSKRHAAKKAMILLYKQAYPELFNRK